MAEKTSQTNSSSNNLPSVPAVAPTSDTPYIQPIIGKLGYDTKHPDIFGIGASPDNGVSFRVFASFDGLVFNDNDIDAIWDNGTSEKVKSEVNSATAEIPAVKSAADEAVKKADSAIASSKVNSDAIANMKSAVSAVKSDASAAASDAIKNLNDVKSTTSSAYQELHSSVASNQVIIDSTSKSLDGLATDLSKYAQDAVSQGKTIAELKQNQSDVSATVASVEGNVNQLKVDTKNIQATASDNKSDIANLQISASSASLAIKDANSNAAVATATASQAYVGLQDAKSNIASVQATANGLKGTVANAESDINQVKTDAQGMHEQITNANSQIATINTSVNGLQTSVNSFNSSVGELNKATQANSTAIEQNAKAIALKASQTSVNDLANSVNSQAASLTVMNNAISTKVTSADVEKAIDDKGYVTKAIVESSINQKANQLTESIANLNGNVQNITATVDGLKTTVQGKADQSQITQLTNVVQSKVSSKDYQTAISQLTDDINAKVAKGDLISQFNMEAGQTLIQSKKLFLDADSVVFSGKAFIPDAAIENLSLDKLTTGHLNIPLQDKDGNSISLNSKGITVASPGASEKAGEFSHMLFNLGNGKLSLEGDLHKISSGETEHYRLGSFQATYDYLDKIGSKVDDGGKYIQQSLGMSFVIDTLDPGQTADKNGDFFALARSQYNSSNPAYVNGVLYNTTGNRREIGLHTFDPLYIHPYGADGYIQSTWVSWSNWNNGEKMPALTQAGINWGGIGFPKNGKVTLFDSDGHAFQPYGGSNYDDYQKQYHIGG